MPRAATIRSLADICEDQWGLFTRKQAEATGMAWTTLARLAKDGVAQRVAHGVYRLRGNASDGNLGVCAAWLQLAPDTMVWHRTAGQGVVCRWSAAAVYGLGFLAGSHQFTLPVRRQTRRTDVKLYKAFLAEDELARIGGLLVTRPCRIVADLLGDGEDLVAVAHVLVVALCEAKSSRAEIAGAVAPYASRFGFADRDGLSLVEWLANLAQHSQPVRGRDKELVDAALSGQQILLVRADEVPTDCDGGATIHLTTVMRQRNQIQLHCESELLASVDATSDPWPSAAMAQSMINGIGMAARLKTGHHSLT